MRVLKIKKLVKKVGKSKPTIYRDMAAGTFPQSLRLGSNSVGWLESEIDAWIEARAAERETAGLSGCRTRPEAPP